WPRSRRAAPSSPSGWKPPASNPTRPAPLPAPAPDLLRPEVWGGAADAVRSTVGPVALDADRERFDSGPRRGAPDHPGPPFAPRAGHARDRSAAGDHAGGQAHR